MESYLERPDETKQAPFVHLAEKRRIALSLEYGKLKRSGIPLPRDTRSSASKRKWSDFLHFVLEKLQLNQLLLHRLLFCLFAVLLLWLTTYKVASVIAQHAIPSPLFASVHDTCYFSYEQVLQQRDEYEQCAAQQLHTCNSQYQSLLLSEQNRSTSGLFNHSNIVENRRLVHEELQVKYALALELLNVWSLHNTIPYAGADTCSDSELQRTKQIIGDLSVVSSIMMSTNSYVSNVKATLKQLHEYTDASEAYHAAYILNHTEAIRKLIISHVESIAKNRLPGVAAEFTDVNRIVDTLLACLLPPSVYSTAYSCPQPSLHTIYTDNIYYANVYVARATKTFTNIHAEVASHAAKLATLLQKVNTFFDSVTQMSKWVVNKMPVSELKNMAELCSKSSPSWCDFSKADWLIDTLHIPDQPLVFNMPNATVLFSKIRPAISSLRSELFMPSVKINTAAANMVAAIETQIGISDLRPKDYHPPQYSDFAQNKTINDAIADHDKSSRTYIENLTHGFDTIVGTLGNKTYTPESVAPPSLTNFTLPLPIFSTHDFSLLSMSGQHVNVLSWFVQVNSIQAVFILLDVIFRLLQTLRLVRKYYRKSYITLPIVKLHQTRGDYLEALTMMFSYSGNIGIFIAAALVGIVLIVYAMSVSYIPLLQSYKNTCVYHSQNATFITHNLHAAAYNYAQGSGSRQVLNGLKGYNYQYNRDCSTLHASSATENEKYRNELMDLQKNIMTHEDNLQLLSRCVVVSVLDSEMRKACCGKLGYGACEEDDVNGFKECPMNMHTNTPYPIASHYLAGERSANVTLSQAAVFNCDALPLCDISCSGPSEAMLQRSTHECGCVVEWGIHAAILRTLLVVLIFVIMNVSRYLVCKGLLAVSWRTVAEGRFQLVTDCDEDETLLHGEELPCHDANKKHDDLPSSGASSRSVHSCFSDLNINDIYAAPTTSQQEKLRDRVKSTIRIFEIKGFIYIAIGVTLNVVWIVLLELLGTNLAYASS